MTSVRRKLPPYAHDIIAARQSGEHRWGTSSDGQHPTLIVCVGRDAWRVARDWTGHRLVTLLPPGEDPALLDWRCLSKADPVLMWRCGAVGGDVVLELLKAIMRDGTDRVMDIATGNRYVARVEEVRDERAA